MTKGALLRARDARAQGVHTGTLTRMVRAGELERLGPGRYCQAGADAGENHSLALACGAVPSGVVCLLSALRFHNIGTQLPREVWLAVPRGTRVPRLSYPPLRLTRVSAPLFSLGIEEHRIEGQRVKVASVARTVADCFRFRSTVGMDVVLEALVEARRSRRLDLNELHRIAKDLRVDRVMRPYLEMLVL
jgi:predicted transcriptional regulator of viral defense system